tara:strand:- start:1449 stop:2072 length:624 start_codon:yes stop_codon:yes gene_type:complete
MSNEIVPLFSTPLYKSSVDVGFIDTAFLQTLEYEQYPDGTGWTSKDVHILLSDPFQKLKELVDQHMRMYCFEFLKLEGCDVKHCQSWINLHKPGNHSPKHYHSNSCYSGGVYLDVPDGSGGLIFNQSHTQPTYITGTVKPPTSEGNLFNADRWGFDVRRGDLFIFPSHLEHQTDVNTTNKNRYMVAFNYFLEGQIGDDMRHLRIKVS